MDTFEDNPRIKLTALFPKTDRDGREFFTGECLVDLPANTPLILVPADQPGDPKGADYILYYRAKPFKKRS